MKRKAIVFLWRGRVWSFAGIHRFVARGGGRTKVSAGVARGDCATRIQRIPPRGAGLRTVPRAGAERSHVVESAKPGKPPPAEPREARREGAEGAQRRATRFAEGENHPPPLRETCERECELPPKAFPRSASCPPRGRGNERFLLSFNGRTRSARHKEHPAENFEFRRPSRHLSGLTTRHRDTPSPGGGGVGKADGGGYPSPAHRGGAALRAAVGHPTRAGAVQTFSTMQSSRARLPGEPCSPALASKGRAIPSTQTTRPRHKRRTLSAKQTFRFNLPASAFVGVSATVRFRREKRHSPPLPQKAGADG